MRPQEVLKDRWLDLRQLLLEQADALLPAALHLELELGEPRNDSRLDDRPGRFYWAVELAAVGGNEVHLAELLQQLQPGRSFVGAVVVNDEN